MSRRSLEPYVDDASMRSEDPSTRGPDSQSDIARNKGATCIPTTPSSKSGTDTHRNFSCVRMVKFKSCAQCYVHCYTVFPGQTYNARSVLPFNQVYW